MATSYDYEPLLRSTVSSDRVFSLLENAQRARSISDWPPHGIVKTDDDSYRISIAVTGFAQNEPEITFQSYLLTVNRKKQETADDDYLHRGIAGRSSTASSLPTMSKWMARICKMDCCRSISCVRSRKR